MRYLVTLLVLVSYLSGSAQLYDYFIVSRNTGEMEMFDGKVINVFGFTQGLGQRTTIPSPVLYMNQGDTMHVVFRNISQGAPHTIHPHGLDVDQQNDGVPHLSFAVEHEEMVDYYITAPHPGTYIYHCHVVSTLHVQAGMYGLIIVRPEDGSNAAWTGGPEFDNEYAWIFSEIDTVWHQRDYAHQYFDHDDDRHGGPQLIPDTFDPQYFLVNGKTEHQLDDLSTHIKSKPREATILRLANIGFMMEKVIIPSALNPEVIATDGFPIPGGRIWDTIVMTPGERYDVMLYPDDTLHDHIQIEYYDLNTYELKSTQYAPVSIQDAFVGVEEETYVESFKVYPNPMQTVFNVDMEFREVSQGFRMYVTDVLGRMIYERAIPDGLMQYNKTVSMRKQSIGMYTVRVMKGDRLVSHRKIYKNQ